jgi:pimeloyl-ACP methyl ester carboxylesterase
LLVDLIQVTTRDGVRLDGMFQAPSGSLSVAVDAFCFVHGTGSNFYSSTLFDALSERFRELGCGILRVNTRGHDGISNAVTARGGQRLGAAYEVMDDCRHDLAAWLGWLQEGGFRHVGLVGHSGGAVKCLYALAHEPQIPAACVVAVSPPRLSYSWFCSSPQGQEFLEAYQRAEQLVENKQPLALLEVKLPLPFVITAAGYVEKYSPEERYNYLRFLTGIRCPVLITLGGVEVENNIAFRGAPEAIQEIAMKRPHIHVGTVAGADHFYTAARGELIARVESWLAAALPDAK